MNRDDKWKEMLRVGRPRGCRGGRCGARTRGARARRSDCAVRTLVVFLLVGVCFGDGGEAQQLWNIEEVAAKPVPPVVMDGMAVSAAAAGAPTAEAATVQVAFDYLRLGIGYLELPLPDGSVIEAENAVFEDRGNGNLMWTGEVPGAGYESVVLTVQDGHLAGSFGEPGGPQYTVRAGPDGSGSLAVEAGPTGDWCGHGTVEEEALHRHHYGRETSGAGIEKSAGAISTDMLDILVAFDEGAAAYWKRAGGIHLAIQSVGDYFNMVLRNSGLSTSARAIPVGWSPETGSAPLERHRYPGLPYTIGETQLIRTKNLGRIRLEERADLVVVVEFPRTNLWRRGEANPIGYIVLPEAGQYGFGSGVSAPALSTGYVFAHELGHNLGSGHEAPYDRCCGTAGQTSYCGSSLPAYACGHTDVTASPQPVHTIMSYGRVPSGSPYSRQVPYFSSPELYKPNDWTLGVIGEADNVLAFQETTLPRAVRLSDIAVPQPPGATGLSGHWTGRGSVELTWDAANVIYVGIRLDDDYWDSACCPGPESSGVSAVLSARMDGWIEDPSSLERVGVHLSGLRPGGRYSFFTQSGYPISVMSDVLVLEPPEGGLGMGLEAPSNVAAQGTGADSVRLTWADNSNNEDGFEVWYRKWTPGDPHWSDADLRWRRYGEPLPAGNRHVDVDGLVAEEGIQVTDSYWENRVWVQGTAAKRGRYSFVVLAYNDQGFNASETFDLEFLPEPYPEPTASGETTDCAVGSRPTGIDLDGYQVHACLETPDGARRRAWDYRLEADQSALLYFFNRDNAEILVKVLDGCAINGHRWVYLAPVTTLAFRLQIWELGPYLANRRQVWYYDSERRPQDQIQGNLSRRVGNPKDRTARTVSDTTAFPCTTAEMAAAKATSGKAKGTGFASLLGATLPAATRPARSLSAGSSTDCEPGGPALTLRGGYTVSMCYETYNGEVGDARDWGLDSSQSGLMYFFERNNAEVLIKVLDGCGVNGHRWVFVAPVTDLAFNLVVESPSGERWTNRNRLGQTADAASDVSAFPCTA